MACGACELTIISRVVMAIETLVPRTQVFAAIDRKILAIMIKSRWVPGRFRMACGTISGKLEIDVVGVCSIDIVVIVTSYASGWCIIIISIVTCYTI